MSSNRSNEIAAHVNSRLSEPAYLRLLRSVAGLGLLAGAAGSLGFMFHVGRHQPSFVVLALFTGWVLAPFLALFWAHIVAKRWPTATRITLAAVMLVVTLGSLGLYEDVAFGPPRPQPAFRFLWVPLASWLVIALVPIAASLTNSGSGASRYVSGGSTRR